MCNNIMVLESNNKNLSKKQDSFNQSNLFTFFMKGIIFFGAMFYLTLLFLGLFTGIFYGYSMIETSMSYLGTIRTTPLPLLFNLSCIFGGLVTILTVIVVEKKLVSEQYPKAIKIFNKLGLLIGIMAGIGTVFVGVFHMDFSQVLHNIATGFAFGGLIFTTAVFGISLILYQTKISRISGSFGLIIPGLMLLGWGFFKIAIFEWLMLFSVLLFLIPLGFQIFRKL